MMDEKHMETARKDVKGKSEYFVAFELICYSDCTCPVCLRGLRTQRETERQRSRGADGREGTSQILKGRTEGGKNMTYFCSIPCFYGE